MQQFIMNKFVYLFYQDHTVLLSDLPTFSIIVFHSSSLRFESHMLWHGFYPSMLGVVLIVKHLIPPSSGDGYPVKEGFVCGFVNKAHKQFS